MSADRFAMNSLLCLHRKVGELKEIGTGYDIHDTPDMFSGFSFQ